MREISLPPFLSGSDKICDTSGDDVYAERIVG
jgi:hypothetical protein